MEKKLSREMADEVIYPIMIPIMSSMMLFFIKVEKNRICLLYTSQYFYRCA